MKSIRKFVFIFISVIITITAYSQGENKEEKKADEAYMYGEYAEAINFYREAYAKSDNVRKAEIIYKTAMCYLKLHEPKSSELWFKKAIQVKYPDPLAVLYYADSKKMNGLFEEAIVEYQKYKKLVPDDERADIGITSSKMAASWIANPTRYKVENMAFFNDRASDFSPVYAKNDFKQLYFSSNREGSKGTGVHRVTGAGFYDLWETQKDRKGKWGIPVPVAAETINTENDEGASSLNLKGNSLYFTRCRVEKKMMLGCAINFATKKGVSWGEPIRIEIPGTNDSVSYGHPAVSNDDLTLYFSAQIPGGQGGNDIWKIVREKTTKPWGEPINLGPEVNTPGNEVFPFEREDGTFYFSSDYHGGMGGLDIFKAAKDGSGKYVVENLKFPINSAADDFGIIFEGNMERGFFSSSRKGGKGSDDIYEFYLPPVEFYISGIVYDKKTNKVLPGSKIILKGSEANTKEITSLEMLAEADGSYRFKLNANTDYQIQASKEKYLNGFGAVSTVGIENDKEFKEDIYLDGIPNIIKLENIFYELGKWTLLPESMVELDHLLKILNNNSNITIELRSHTDFRSSDSFNDTLSQKRAQSVVDYLIQKGIDPERLTAKGYGERLPSTVDSVMNARYSFLPLNQSLSEPFIKTLATVEEQEVAHQYNRRTEFKVLKTDYVPKPSAIINNNEEEGEGDTDNQ